MTAGIGRTAGLALLALATVLAGGIARAQSGGTYDLSWSTIDGGGITTAGGGSYALDGTLGQWDAGQMAGGTYVLGGGFWGGGVGFVLGVKEPGPSERSSFGLRPGVPNPFFGSTALMFTIVSAQHATMAIYDLRGARVKTLLDETLAPGRHSVRWDGTDDSGRHVAHGVYLVRLDAGDHSASTKVVQLGN